MIKVNTENNEIIECSFIDPKIDDINKLVVGVYLRIYQTDSNGNTLNFY